MFIDYNSAMSWFDDAEEILAKKKKFEQELAGEWNKFSPRAQQVLDFSIKEARETKTSCIGTEHLLMGLIALGSGVPFHLLKITD